MAEIIVSIRDLHYQYQRQGQKTVPLFAGLNLDIEQGSFVALMGPSGVGKSTLLRLVGGLLKPVSGTITVSQNKDRPENYGFVFQDARLLPWRKVWKNVGLGLESMRMPRPERRRIAFDLLDRVGMKGFEKRLPGHLSGGQRQRVAIARALAIDPVLLLMDEPFSALDAMTRTELHAELRDIVTTTGKTVLFVTHDANEADALASRQIMLGHNPDGSVGIMSDTAA